jgi:hypothetical protein
MLTFHSLRSGFLVSNLIKAGTNKERRTAVLETAGMVAGWLPASRPQMQYVRPTAIKLIIANRLVLLNGIDSFLSLIYLLFDGNKAVSIYIEDLNENVLEEELCSSKNFHGLSSDLVSKWNYQEVNFRAFVRRMTEK